MGAEKKESLLGKLLKFPKETVNECRNYKKNCEKFSQAQEIADKLNKFGKKTNEGYELPNEYLQAPKPDGFKEKVLFYYRINNYQDLESAYIHAYLDETGDGVIQDALKSKGKLDFVFSKREEALGKIFVLYKKPFMPDKNRPYKVLSEPIDQSMVGYEFYELQSLMLAHTSCEENIKDPRWPYTFNMFSKSKDND